MATLQFQINKALSLINQNSNLNKSDFSLEGIGMKTIDFLISERLMAESKTISGQQIYNVTAKGKEEFSRPKLPPPPKRKARLTMLQPRIKTMPPRI